MDIFVDCEFNGFGGELISMAMVTGDGDMWYRVRGYPKIWDKWVYENVYPVLHAEPIGREEFRASAIEWLKRYNKPHICADWYTDLLHFYGLFAGKSHMDSVGYACTSEVRLIDSYNSEIPHNALCDAKAIREVWYERA